MGTSTSPAGTRAGWLATVTVPGTQQALPAPTFILGTGRRGCCALSARPCAHMSFDLTSPRPTGRVKQLVTVSQYLTLLREQGKVDDASRYHLPPNWRNDMKVATEKMTVAVQSLTGSKGSPPRTWKRHVLCPMAPPYRVLLECPGRSNTLVIGNGTLTSEVSPSTTVDELCKIVWRECLPAPTTEICLEHWGTPLDRGLTLAAYSIPNEAHLQVRFTERRTLKDRGLDRVRVSCTALSIQAIDVEATCSGMRLKELIKSNIESGSKTFWDSEGQLHCIEQAVTLLALASLEGAAEGTPALRRGEELIIDQSQSLALRGGKDSVVARRYPGGDVVNNISEALAMHLQIQPSQMRLSFRGTEIEDHVLLWDAGIRQDDKIQLEFESPVIPEELKLLRSPATEKATKKASGKKN